MPLQRGKDPCPDRSSSPFEEGAGTKALNQGSLMVSMKPAVKLLWLEAELLYEGLGFWGKARRAGEGAGNTGQQGNGELSSVTQGVKV